MGREVLKAALCCIMFGVTLAKQSTTSQVKDSESAASAPKLYRNVPVGVYASATPYGASSFQIPSFTSFKTAASHLVPVKEETTVIQNTNGFLKDSYGNRFVETPQNVAFRTTFPQQFVQLQDLPLHLSQPLTAASPSFQFKPTQFVIGPHYKLPFQAAPARYGTPQPVHFADNFKGFAPPQGFGEPQSLIPGQSAALVQKQTNHGAQPSAAPAENFAAPQSFAASQSFAPAQATFAAQVQPNTQQQSTSNKAVYANIHPQEQYRNFNSEHKFQRLEEAPRESHVLENAPQPVVHNSKLELAPSKQAITTIVNGKKTIINLETRPPIPLLDISLLEPLTFKNPLVPQVQHFLPRINQATYHKLPTLDEAKNYQKEFMIQKTKSYDSTKPHKNISKKKQKKPLPPKNEEPVRNHEELPQKPTLDESPEIAYEITSPGYKETYKEQAISYNKETQSEPVHYTYGSKTEKEPVTYNYAHSSKEPLQIKQSHYQSNGKGPMQLIYHFKPEEKHIENQKHSPQQNEDAGENEEESEEQSDNYQPVHNQNPQDHEKPHSYHDHHHAQPNEHSHHNDDRNHEDTKRYPNHGSGQKQYNEELKHSEDEPKEGQFKHIQHNHESTQRNPEYYPQALQLPVTTAEYHPLNQYEEEIQFLPPTKSESIRVDPNQHVKNKPQEDRPSPEPLQPSHPSTAPHTEQYTPIHPQSYENRPPQHIHEKSKQIIIQEETPEEMHSLREQLKAEMIEEEENNEEDFENAYKNSAQGFPAYNRAPIDEEKDIYNPANYGIPRDHSNYDIDHSPFQQYQREGDEFPKEARSNYKDDRDHMKEDYYLDYSVSRPESLSDRYSKKADYYKLYKKQTPEKYLAFNEDKKKEKSAKYTAAPYDYPVKEQKPKQQQYFAQYKESPNAYGYNNYAKEALKDNSAHATRPFQKYRTHFVEPQFQYGFEPVTIPLLLDSELAAMASNDSPESEKPGMRKKLYKENWYIKKTSTLGGAS